jgi:hypothetical protein
MLPRFIDEPTLFIQDSYSPDSALYNIIGPTSNLFDLNVNEDRQITISNIQTTLLPYMKFPPDFTPSFTPSFDQELPSTDFVTLYYNLVCNGEYSAGDIWNYQNFFVENPDFSDITDNYIGLENLGNIIINAFTDVPNLIANETVSCSIYDDTESVTPICKKYIYVYLGSVDLMSDLNTLSTIVLDPDDPVLNIFTDMISFLNILQTIFPQ